jgi:O-methyltransferase involved in polyketide biosynthesis
MSGSCRSTRARTGPSRYGVRCRESIDLVTRRWREAGFDPEFGDLGYSEQRKDVADYLAERGWQSAKTHIQQLLAGTGLPALPEIDGSAAIGNTHYSASVRA